MKIQEYIEGGYDERTDVEGFTIRGGRKVYWYITPTKYGMYRCLPLQSDKTLGWPRYVDSGTEVTVVFG